MKKIFFTLLLLILTGCASRWEQYQTWQIDTSPKHGSYFAWAQSVLDERGIWATNVSQEIVNQEAIEACERGTGHKCVVAYEGNNYVKDQNVNKYYNSIRQAKINNYAKNCEAYGFKRGTNELANCVMNFQNREDDDFNRAISTYQESIRQNNPWQGVNDTLEKMNRNSNTNQLPKRTCVSKQTYNNQIETVCE